MHAVRQATPERVPAIAAMLARAFATDAIVNWPFGAVSDLAGARRRLFEELNVRFAAHGLLWEVGDAEGAALWVDPESLDVWKGIDDEMREPVGRLTDDAGARNDALWDWIGARIPEEPLWFLDHVGVEPAFQGRGIGRSLIAHGLVRAHGDGVPAFLETAVAANVPFYEQLGFRLVDDGDAPLDGPHIWFMRSDPQSE